MKKLFIVLLATLVLVGCGSNPNKVDTSEVINKFNEQTALMNEANNMAMELGASMEFDGQSMKMAILLGYEKTATTMNKFLMDMTMTSGSKEEKIAILYDGEYVYMDMSGNKVKEPMTEEDFETLGMSESVNTEGLTSQVLGSDTKVEVTSDGNYTLTVAANELAKFNSSVSSLSSLYGTAGDATIKSVVFDMSKDFKITGGTFEMSVKSGDVEIQVPVQYKVLGYGDDYKLTMPDLSGY